MERPELEIAHLFEKFGDQLNNLHPTQSKVVNAIRSCRTEALGHHVLSCNHCGHKQNSYNSCRNRHCPKCQFLTKVKWIEKRKADLLPCHYFHLVFTIPNSLRRLFLYNKELCYNLLFKTSSETLKEVSRKPKNLGAEIGFIGVLHTWSQNLIDHPHVHYVVPAGGLNNEKNKWVKSRNNYFLSVKVLSVVFKAKLLKALKQAYCENRLNLTGELEELLAPHIFDNYLNDLAAKDWIVYAKKPFGGPEQVINYLGQYTHRIAISNYRLVRLKGDKITFKVRDKDNPGHSKLMTLNALEFLRRFLLHVLPKGFVRIRHFGILGSRSKKEKIQLIRELEKIIESLVSEIDLNWQELLLKTTGIDLKLCPSCKEGELTPTAGEKGVVNSS